MRNSKTSSSRKSNSKASSKKTSNVSPSTEEQKDAEALKDELLQSKKSYAEWDLLSAEVKEGLAKLGYVDPTPVQSASIEPALTGRDLVVQAKTGTGKTSSFGIPLVEQISVGGELPQGLVLAPTRELAKQVGEELKNIAHFKGSRILSLYGGTSINEQIKVLEEGVDIIVGTPGRVLDHIRRKTLKTSNIKHIALDEADEMLSMGFFLEVTTILERCNNRKQMLLFSATIPPDIEGLVRQFTHKPMRLMVSGGDRKVEGIGHGLYFINDEIPRSRNLLYILELEAPERAMIFCNRKVDTALIASYLLRQGKNAEALHGDMDQKERERVLKKIKNNDVQYLVATDVASRGIDISGLTHVINYHFPPSADLYIHRVGRTGRGGRQGTAISMATGADAFHIVQLKRLHEIFFDVQRIPDAKEVIKVATSRHVGELFSEALKTVFEPYLALADGLLDDPRGRFVVAHLLKLYHDGEIKNIQEALDKTEQLLPKAPVEPAPKASHSDAAKSERKEEKSSKTEAVEAPAPTENESSEKSEKQEEEPKEATTKLYFKNAGSSEDYDEEKLTQLILEQTELSEDAVRHVQIERNYAYVTVLAETAEQVIETFQNNEEGITAEIAKKRPRKRRRR